jgi:DNA-binding NarL/FixJ family response regulator
LLTVVVIDDHLLVREGLKQVLKQIDDAVEMYEAPNAAEGLRLTAACQELDLVLLDLSLPDRSGFEALPEIKRLRNDVPVVVLSASTSSADVQRALQGGAAGFIPKSSTAGVTLGALRLVLSGGIYVPPEILLTPENPADGQTPPKLAHGLGAAKPQVSAQELGLSERQMQVLLLLVQGKTNKAIARELDLAEQTVKAHISAVLRALSVSNRTQAVIAVAQLGLNSDKPVAATGAMRVPS